MPNELPPLPPAPPNAPNGSLPPLQPLHQPPPSQKQPKLGLILGITFGILALIGTVVLGLWFISQSNKQNNEQSPQTNNSQAKVDGLQLDPKKDYGNEYANGILPVGDNQYSTVSATKGKVFLCKASFVPASQAGAQNRGPWFIGATQWDIKKKYAVQGSMAWKNNVSTTFDGARRIIHTNSVPDHGTGNFPVAPSDPAYQYDKNPNVIKEQKLNYDLPRNPSYGEPKCMGGEAGVMMNGPALFNGFDAGGRDAGAWEVQDACEGHPQKEGLYHYHTLSSCITDVSVSKVIGFALDGFPITGPKLNENNILTTQDLDECHGIVSEVMLDTQKKTTYHYVMTQDFPYSVSCFRGTPIDAPGAQKP